MIFVFSFYYRDNGDICFEHRKIDNKYEDKKAYEESSDFNSDIYLIKLDILQRYFDEDNIYKKNIKKNRPKYENDFDEFFEHSYLILENI